jgi:hypothetical protein
MQQSEIDIFASAATVWFKNWIEQIVILYYKTALLNQQMPSNEAKA